MLEAPIFRVCSFLMPEWNPLIAKPNWARWLSASRLPEKATAQPKVAVPLLNPAIVPISTAGPERQGCKPEQSSSMFYCTPAVNGPREPQEIPMGKDTGGQNFRGGGREVVCGSASAAEGCARETRTLETEGCGTQPPNPSATEYYTSPQKENRKERPLAHAVRSGRASWPDARLPHEYITCTAGGARRGVDTAVNGVRTSRRGRPYENDPGRQPVERV